MENTANVLLFPVNGNPVVKRIKRYDITSMQNMVGGYFNCVDLDEEFTAYVNEEGYLYHLPMNRGFYGQFFVARTSEGDIDSVSDKDLGLIEKLLEKR